MCFCHFHFFLCHRHCRRLYIFIVSFLFPPFWRFPSSTDLCFSLLVVNFHFPSINRWMWVRILPARVHNVVDSWRNLNCHNTHTYFQCQSSCYGKNLRNNHGRRNEMTWKTLRKKFCHAAVRMKKEILHISRRRGASSWRRQVAKDKRENLKLS